MWHRVFCRSSAEVKPAELLASLSSHAVASFKGDDLGWTSAEFELGKGSPVFAERFLTSEDDLRNDLNTWAAWLETMTYSPNHGRLMEHVVQTQQLITIRKPVDHSNEVAVDELCQSLCRVLAATADGVYQIEGDGWYSAEGALLLQEY